MKSVEEALFESRPYVEYWDRLKGLVDQLLKESTSLDNLIDLLNEEMERAEEPFKTDIRIFLQKLESLKG